MSWQVYLGLSVFTAVFALLKSAELIKKDEGDDATSASIKSAFKIVFIGTALIVSAVGVGAGNHILEGTIDADTNLNKNAETDAVEDTTSALYKALLNVNIVFVSLLLFFVAYMGIRNVKDFNNKGKKERRGFV